ncbi:MAG TPA: glycoside hydrolase family 3 N-terminal domain-containing protein [Candidatus Saccharimonadales bacterium]|nr:glycoside hydrolase family 3 N-terminal domain-containing protein [Candidatus Saccharimonadales bacterium]
MAVRKKRSGYLWRRIAISAVIAAAAVSGIFWKFSEPGAPADKAVHTAPGQNSLTALQCAARLPLAEQAGQVLMVGLTAKSMSEQAAVFKRYHVGGAVIMTSPDNPADDSINIFKTTGGSKNIPLLISTDEEGGQVQRFKSLGLLPAPADMAGLHTASQAQAVIAAHAKKLKAVGVDMVLGPLADVAPENGDSPLGDRIFSSDPQVVSNYDLAYVRGWQAGGLLPTLKHFPGMGSASGNTDFQPATTPPLSQLKERDFIPYRNLPASGTAIMVGNQSVPGWSDGPASLSPVVYKYLRDTLGLKDSLIITDSLAAQAVNGQISVSGAVVQAIAAGGDVAIVVDPHVDKITVQENTALIKQSVLSLEAAVSDGKVPRQRLAQAAQHKLAAQKISPCALLKAG